MKRCINEVLLLGPACKALRLRWTPDQLVSTSGLGTYAFGVFLLTVAAVMRLLNQRDPSAPTHHHRKRPTMCSPDTRDLRAAERIMKECPPQLQLSGGALRRTSSRVCLSVEHGDYNGAPLFGVGVDRYIWFAYKPNQLTHHRLFSFNIPHQGIVTFEPGTAPAQCTQSIAGSWARFPFGIDWVLRNAGFDLQQSIDGVIVGDIPGGGMSRSASLPINLMLSLFDANGIRPPETMRIAELAQKVENDYIGSPCGLLDQVMILFAKRGRGTHFDPVARSIDFVPLPPGADEFRIALLDTGTERAGLEKSRYRIRRAECASLVDRLRDSGIDIDNLANITDEMYRNIVLGHPPLPSNLLKRLRYIYHAVGRFDTMLAAWKDGDITTVGNVFREDVFGRRFDYEISGPELDAVCDIARRVPGVLGERMLGGGDKGAAAAIVRTGAIARLARTMETDYSRDYPELSGTVSVSELQTADGVAVFGHLLR